MFIDVATQIRYNNNVSNSNTMNTTTGLTEDQLMDLSSYITYLVTSDDDMLVVDHEMCIDYLETQDIVINDTVIDQVHNLLFP